MGGKGVTIPRQGRSGKEAAKAVEGNTRSAAAGEKGGDSKTPIPIRILVLVDKGGREKYYEICKISTGGMLILDEWSVDAKPDDTWKEKTKAKIKDARAIAVIMSESIGNNEGARWAVGKARDMKKTVIGIRMAGIKPTNNLETHRIIGWNPSKIIGIIGVYSIM